MGVSQAGNNILFINEEIVLVLVYLVDRYKIFFDRVVE